MAAIPEFILRKLYVQGSLQVEEDRFSFALSNTFAPATLTAFRLEVDGQPVPPEKVSIQAGEGAPQPAADLSAENPYPFPVGESYIVVVQGTPLGQGRLTLHAETREAGLLSFSVQTREGKTRSERRLSLRLPRLFRRPYSPLKAEILVDFEALIGEIHPYVYGHFVEHLEGCVYGGIWSQDGAHLRQDTLELVQALNPPLIRYPGGNFASGYHWEDGIGPRQARLRCYDQAWNAWESNQVGTGEFLDFCARVGAQPFLVANDGSGTPEEAARWVAYCNQPSSGEQGKRRTANGHPEPYGVQLWGVGNEVWGQWQIGHTSAAAYAARLRQFAAAMRGVDPSIRIAAVGDKVLSDAPDDPGRVWNEVVLRQAGELIDDLSFHLYQPEQGGWQENYDQEALHHTVCAAPLDAEAAIQRMAGQIAALAPGREIRVAFDEWNLWLPPPEEAGSMHQVVYTLRDALYCAGMLNAFHHQCNHLAMANLAQLVNVLPAIVAGQGQAYATPIYYPFWMYQHMQHLALRAQTEGTTFDSSPLGNIAAHQSVPYLDVSATRDERGRRLVLGLVNRHPARKMQVQVALRGFPSLKPVYAWLLSGPDPLAGNSDEEPERVGVREIELPEMQGDSLRQELPAASVLVLSLAGAERMG